MTPKLQVFEQMPLNEDDEKLSPYFFSTNFLDVCMSSPNSEGRPARGYFLTLQTFSEE